MNELIYDKYCYLINKDNQYCVMIPKYEELPTDKFSFMFPKPKLLYYNSLSLDLNDYNTLREKYQKFGRIDYKSVKVKKMQKISIEEFKEYER